MLKGQINPFLTLIFHPYTFIINEEMLLEYSCWSLSLSQSKRATIEPVGSIAIINTAFNMPQIYSILLPSLYLSLYNSVYGHRYIYVVGLTECLLCLRKAEKKGLTNNTKWFGA